MMSRLAFDNSARETFYRLIAKRLCMELQQMVVLFKDLPENSQYRPVSMPAGYCNRKVARRRALPIGRGQLPEIEVDETELVTLTI